LSSNLREHPNGYSRMFSKEENVSNS